MASERIRIEQLLEEIVAIQERILKNLGNG